VERRARQPIVCSSPRHLRRSVAVEAGSFSYSRRPMSQEIDLGSSELVHQGRLKGGARVNRADYYLEPRLCSLLIVSAVVARGVTSSAACITFDLWTGRELPRGQPRRDSRPRLAPSGDRDVRALRGAPGSSWPRAPSRHSFAANFTLRDALVIDDDGRVPSCRLLRPASTSPAPRGNAR